MVIINYICSSGVSVGLSVRDTKYGILAIVILALAFRIKADFFDYVSWDYTHFLSMWMDNIRFYGLTKAFGQDFYDYTPLYIYILGVVDTALYWVPALYIPKIIALMSEVSGAYFAWRILQQLGVEPHKAFVGAVGVLALPSVIVNGAAIGQCDMVYSSFLLGSLAMLMERRPICALIYFGIAFAFKLQAVFMGPVLLAALLGKHIPWRWIWVPFAVWLVVCIPAWLEGRGASSLLYTYIARYNSVPRTWWGNAANFYWMMPHKAPGWMAYVGMAVTAVAGLVMSLSAAHTLRSGIGAQFYLLLACLSTAVMPFLLPGMHERYFFPSQLLVYLYAFYRPSIVSVFMAMLWQCDAVMNEWKGNFDLFERWSGMHELLRQQVASGITAVIIVMLCFLYREDIIRFRKKGYC